MEQKTKEIRIFNITLRDYCDLVSKKDPSCYDVLDVSAIAAGCASSYSFETGHMRSVLEQAEDEIRGNAAKNGAFVVVNAEYSQAIGGAGSQYSGSADYSVMIKGIALKDKGG